MTVATQQSAEPVRPALSSKARELMEQLNTDAAKSFVWVRTQMNAPAQRPWFTDTGGATGTGQMASGRVAANQLKAAAHRWRWKEYSTYLQRIAGIASQADVSPIEFADRQSILLTNPGLNGRLQVTNTIRCAISIYNPGDIAPAHVHSPNASRTILTEKGGYTNVEGERCEAARGDIILTPNGTWHDHGNDGEVPVIWIDMLDWPLMEFLDCAWVDQEFQPSTGSNGKSEIGGQTFDWEPNDIMVVPNFVWRRHINTGANEAVLYTVTDAALLKNIGQYRAQGKDQAGKVVQLVQ